MSTEKKSCPLCAESIKATALKCKHCHADLMTLPKAVPPEPVALEAEEVLDLLSHLVDKNLVIYEEDEHGQGRYQLLETVRQYARDRLLESGAGQVGRGRHRDYVLALAEEAKRSMQGPRQAQWLDTLESEHENLRAALEWCLSDDAKEGAQAGLRLAGSLSVFWRTRGHFLEGRQQCAAALSHPGAQERTKARADTLQGAGTLAWIQGEYAPARALLEDCLTIQREGGDKKGIARSLNNLGLVVSDQGDYASARSLHEESLAIMRELGNKQGIAMSLNNLGIISSEQGDMTFARALLEEGLATMRELGDKQGIARSLMNLGYVATNQGDTASGRSLLGESLATMRELGDKRSIAISLANLGPLACQESDYAAAHTCLAECLTLCQALGEKRVTAYGLEGFAALAKAQGQSGRAVQLYGASDGLRTIIGVPLSPNERGEAESKLAALRTALSENAFHGAWSAGQALTWEQAIAYALEDEFIL